MHHIHTRSVSTLVQSWETKDKYFLPTTPFSYRSHNVMLISETFYSAVDRRGGGPDVGLSWTIRKNSEEVGYFGFVKMCVTLVATLHATVI